MLLPAKADGHAWLDPERLPSLNSLEWKILRENESLKKALLLLPVRKSS